MAAEQNQNNGPRKRSASQLRSDSSKKPNNKDVSPTSIYRKGTGEGTSRNLTYQVIPTKNEFDVLTDNESEIKLVKEKVSSKMKIPPITCFGVKPKSVHESMKTLEIANYSVKLLRNQGIQINCVTADDFKRVNAALSTNKKEFYTHDLPSERTVRFVLKGLGNDYNAEDVGQELKSKGIIPTEIKVMNDESQFFTFVLWFKKGEMTLNKLKDTRFVLNTAIKWEAYHNKRQGITTCSRCQRPGHGRRHCNMGYRCEMCGEGHDTAACPSNEKIKQKLDAITDVSDRRQLRLEIPGKCCNCNEIGHFASDPNCPSKRKYIEKRNRKSKENRTNARQHFKIIPAEYPSITGNSNGHHVATAAAGINGVTYAQRVKILPSNPPPPVGNIPFNFNFSDSNIQNSNMPNSGINPFFSVEETLQLLEEIRTKLPDVTKTPRNEAVLILMQIAIKYLYGKDGCK